MFRKVIFIVALLICAVPVQAKAKSFINFGLNEEEVKDIIRQYIYDNPKVIIESFQRMQMLEEQDRQRQARARINEFRKDLEYDKDTPVIGNPKGDVVIVEFFDYNCGYCKMMYKKVLEAVQKDGNMRWVLKDLPSLGPTSMLAAFAGLAADKQGKYFEMHSALMTMEGGIDEDKVNAAAKKIGLNMKKFKKDMESEEVQKQIEENMLLAQELSLSGVPQFIIGDFVSQGAMMGNELEEAVKVIRFKPGQKAEDGNAKEADAKAGEAKADAKKEEAKDKEPKK